jgi:hypothetical protein
MNQLVEKDAEASIVWFWKAINSGDRVDSALKDMAVVMKQQDRAEEAIEAIRSFRHLCSRQAQESLDNLLIDLYKVHFASHLAILVTYFLNSNVMSNLMFRNVEKLKSR